MDVHRSVVVNDHGLFCGRVDGVQVELVGEPRHFGEAQVGLTHLMVSVWWDIELGWSNLSPRRIKRDVTLEEIGLALLCLNLGLHGISLLLGRWWHSDSFLRASSVETVNIRIPVAFVIMLDNLFRLLLPQIWVQSLHVRVMIPLHVNPGSRRNPLKRRLEE